MLEVAGGGCEKTLLGACQLKVPAGVPLAIPAAAMDMLQAILW